MTTYSEWADRYPEAAAALADVFAPSPGPTGEATVQRQVARTVARAGGVLGEAAAQQQVRLTVARAGAYAWRNNVGSTPARCPHCRTRQAVVRYGLANESTAVNREIKSSDLILAIPRVIEPHQVGQTIAQFGAVECKRPGWKYTGAGRETGQAAWIALINRIGGFGRFSTGEITI